jgi:5-methylcytosine-specific restriction endonuclease McrA
MPKEAICAYCHKVFTKSQNRQKYCGSQKQIDSCSFKKWRRLKVSIFRNCRLCNARFYAYNHSFYCGNPQDPTSCKRLADKLNNRRHQRSQGFRGGYWTKRRVKIIIRDNYQCQKCNLRNTNPSFFDVDHKDGNSHNNDVSNLWTLCPNCHKLKTIDGKEWIKNRTTLTASLDSGERHLSEDVVAKGV